MPPVLKRYGIVASRFNQPITDRLVQSALELFKEKKIPRSQVDVVWVPGAFELPVAALKLAQSRRRYRAVIALGCILKGRTPQYQHLAQATLQGLVTASVLSGVPVTSGVIVAQNWKLALERSQKKRLNRGREAVQAAWELEKTFTRINGLED